MSISISVRSITGLGDDACQVERIAVRWKAVSECTKHTAKAAPPSPFLTKAGRAWRTMGSGIQTLNLAGAPEIEKEPITSAIPRSVKWTRCRASTDSLYMIMLLADADSVLQVTTFSTEVGENLPRLCSDCTKIQFWADTIKATINIHLSEHSETSTFPQHTFKLGVDHLWAPAKTMLAK
jgi:hypothetical protein